MFLTISSFSAIKSYRIEVHSETTLANQRWRVCMNKIVEIDIYKQSLKAKREKDFYLYYCLEGQITVHLSQGSTLLEMRDILVVNPNENITIQCKGNFCTGENFQQRTVENDGL